MWMRKFLVDTIGIVLASQAANLNFPLQIITDIFYYLCIIILFTLSTHLPLFAVAW